MERKYLRVGRYGEGRQEHRKAWRGNTGGLTLSTPLSTLLYLHIPVNWQVWGGNRRELTKLSTSHALTDLGIIYYTLCWNFCCCHMSIIWYISLSNQTIMASLCYLYRSTWLIQIAMLETTVQASQLKVVSSDSFAECRNFALTPWTYCEGNMVRDTKSVNHFTSANQR